MKVENYSVCLENNGLVILCTKASAVQRERMWSWEDKTLDSIWLPIPK
jgi:hypothetical protein